MMMRILRMERSHARNSDTMKALACGTKTLMHASTNARTTKCSMSKRKSARSNREFHSNQYFKAIIFMCSMFVASTAANYCDRGSKQAASFYTFLKVLQSSPAKVTISNAITFCKVKFYSRISFYKVKNS